MSILCGLSITASIETKRRSRGWPLFAQCFCCFHDCFDERANRPTCRRLFINKHTLRFFFQALFLNVSEWVEATLMYSPKPFKQVWCRYSGVILLIALHPLLDRDPVHIWGCWLDSSPLQTFAIRSLFYSHVAKCLLKCDCFTGWGWQLTHKCLQWSSFLLNAAQALSTVTV